MDPSLPTEKFTSQQLKEARKQFNELRDSLALCSQLSQKIGNGKCDFDEILACLYTIEKNPMYSFLSSQDPSLKQIIDVTFLRLRNVGGIVALSMQHDEAEAEETRKMEETMKELDAVVDAKGDIEGALKRTFEEIMEDDEGFSEK